MTAGVLVCIGQDVLAVEVGKFFTVAERDGAWWFLDPDGRPFFSFGVNVASPGPEQSLYDDAHPQYAAWRYYGDQEKWAKATLSRLQRWKFNTIGGWHDRRLRRDGWAYTEVLHIGVELGVPWNDMFDASFATQMDQLAAERVAPHRNDTQLVGWFPDNELGWFSDALFMHHLSQPAESKTRQRLVQLLRERYDGDFSKLTRDFKPAPETNDFEALEKGGGLKLCSGGDGPKVIADFVEAMAERYYDVVCSAIRKHDPNHLILGDRYPGYCPDAVVRAAGRHLDVISTNYDWPQGVDGYLPRCYLRRLHELTGKPVIVTEYYSAATENRSGNPNSGGLFVVTPDQKSRAEVVRRRLSTFADESYIVGAHWFAYADEPTHGRAGDGEDYNFGLVDIHDQPYELLTDGMRQWHVEAVKLHDSSGSKMDRASEFPIEIAPLAAATTLDAIGETLHSQTIVPSADRGSPAELNATWDATHLYLTISGNHFVETSAYAEQPVPLSEGQTWRVTVTHGEQAIDFELQMLGERCALAGPTVEHRHWQRGVRFGATAAIPASQWGVDGCKTGNVVSIRAELCDGSREQPTTWETDLALSK